MSNLLPEVPLANIARPISRPVGVMPGQSYRTIGVKLWGGGAYERETIDGSDTAAKTLSVVREHDLIINKIWVRHGSTAIAGADVEGCAASGEFPTFTLDENQVTPRWLHWQTKTRGFWAKCDALSQGTSGKNRIKPELFLSIRVPLPSLPEQRRIVAKIDQVAHQIQEARGLRHQATDEVEQLIAGEERRLWPDAALNGAPQLESLTTFLARGKQSEQGDSEHFLIKTQHVQQGRYVPSAMRLASHIAIKVKPEAIVQDGDILIACSAAGCLGRVARYWSDNRTASTDTHVAVLRPNPEAVDPDYLYAYLRGAQGQHQLRSRERGDWKREKIGFRLTELNLNDLRRVPVPVPRSPEQRRIVAELDALQAEVNSLKRLQAATATELDAMLPSILDRAFNGEL